MRTCPMCVAAAMVAGVSMLGLLAGMGRHDDPAKGIAGKVNDLAKHIESAGKPPEGHGGEMEAMMAAGRPGAEHEQLKFFVGEWTASAKMWMDPSQPAMESTGKASFTMELGGRVLVQRYEGSMPMGTFTGVGYTGYDNVTKRWWSNWMDDWMTGCMNYYGSFDAKTKTWETKTESFTCPMDGKPASARNVMTITGKDTFTLTMYGTREGEKEMKSGEIAYTRVKK